MNGFTGIKDVDVKIISQLNDYQVTQLCQVNKYINSICQLYWRDKVFIIFKNNKKENTLKDIEVWKGKLTWEAYYTFLLIICKYNILANKE